MKGQSISFKVELFSGAKHSYVDHNSVFSNLKEAESTWGVGLEKQEICCVGTLLKKQSNNLEINC